MIRIKAWAKINIGLKILAKREDGFHDLETTLSTINLSDFLTLEETTSGTTVEAKNLEIEQSDNLCYRAAELFKQRYGIARGVKIELVKNIPIGAGLGGGSADAATVLVGLGKLFNMFVRDEELMEMAREIGSDVPFFIKGGAAYARGRGDELTFFRLPRMDLVLYYPGYAISTKWAYEQYDKMMLTREPDVDTIVQDKRKSKRKGFQLENSFEKVIFQYHPDLLDVKTNLLGTGAFFVSLSGSGSCIFAVVDDSLRPKVIKYLDGIGATYFEVATI
jgi:4-diphosphocytidyl-2-C-methyl-D-erythritol kinase